MNRVIASLEEIARLAKTAREPAEMEKALEAARGAIQLLKDEISRPPKSSGLEMTLDQELSTWQSKLAVIWKESVGREGMARHAKYWVDKLRHSESAEGGRRISK